MPFELSFTNEFFWGEGEPYEVSDRPTSVMQALRSMSDEDYREMSMECFGQNEVDIDLVFGKIRETNTCGTLRSPIDVWIDEDGHFTISVYEKQYEEDEVEEEEPKDERGYPIPTVDEPDFEDLEHMLLFRGTCDATDGCTVEPDGKCEHGHVSWGRYLGFI